MEFFSFFPPARISIFSKVQIWDMSKFRLGFLLFVITFALFGSLAHALGQNIYDNLTTTQVARALVYYLEACKPNE